MINNKEKIDILNNKISNIQIHINILEKNINEYPNNDVEGKLSRQYYLDDFYNQKNILQDELASVENN